MGRFLSPDPSQLYFADPTNPQSLNLYSYALNNPLLNIDPTGTDACAYDNGDGTASIANAADGGGVDCPGNGFYITTSQQVSAVGFNDSGDLSVYGADGNLYNPDGSAYMPAQTIAVNAGGGGSYSGLPTIDSGLTFTISTGNPAPQSIYNLSQAQRIKAIALAAPTICGGGAFGYAGKEVSAGVGHAFQGGIAEYDSNDGTQVGLLTEVGGGEGAVGGYGAIQNPGGVEPIVFGGAGGDVAAAEGSAGEFASTGSIGLYGEIGAGGRVVGGGVYANVTTNAGCINRK